MPKIVLITGANGQLGQEFKALAKNYPHLTCHFFDKSSLDICNAEALKNTFDNIRPNYVLNCAAYTAVDKAEEEKELAFKINATAVGLIADLCAKYNSKLFHFSTDYVFNGEKNTAYTELDKTQAINIYGESKLAGEVLLSTYDNAIIIRTSWLYSSYGNNFVKSMLRLAENRKELSVVCDQIGAPTYARTLAEMLFENIVELGELGSETYHFSNEGIASWYDFAHAIFEISQKEIELYPIPSKDYPTPAKRAVFSLMDKTKIKSITKYNIPHWRDSLIDCLALIKENNE